MTDSIYLLVCGLVFLNEKKWFPSAKNLSHVASMRFGDQDFDSIDALTPLYLYPEDCQVRKMKS